MLIDICHIQESNLGFLLKGFLTQLGSAFILNQTFSFGGIWPINLSIGVLVYYNFLRKFQYRETSAELDVASSQINQIIFICFEKEKDMIHNNWHISAKYPQSIDSRMK